MTGQPAGAAPGDVVELPTDAVPDAVALWHEAGLTRPWNDPEGDCRRALEGKESTVLCLPPSRASDGASGGRLRGTVMVGHDGHRGWIYYLAVRDDLRGQGLGERLVRAAEDWLRARGIPKLMLMVRRENQAVHAFYDRLDYTEQDVVTLGRFL
ncbi:MULTISPECIES: GNAT family acetyltransferase [Actinomycetes]|uniref:GNAT family acetyltransferase n=2 Tax=Actinomycetes TaxID=1760 RepID=A0ABP6LLF9_9MICC